MSKNGRNHRIRQCRRGKELARTTGLTAREALDLAPDDMPDGAAFAMAAEMAGMDYGEFFDELGGE